MKRRNATDMELQEDFYGETKHGCTHDIRGCTMCISHHCKKVSGHISYRCGLQYIVSELNLSLNFALQLFYRLTIWGDGIILACS